MHILALAASALLAAPAPAVDTAPVSQEISVFQRDFPVSNMSGEEQYRRFARDMFDATGAVRQSYLSACGTDCNFLTLRTGGKAGVEWSQGAMATLPAGITGPAHSVFVGQKGHITLVDGQRHTEIDDSYLVDSSAMTGEAGSSQYRSVQDVHTDDWSYFAATSKTGAKVMRLVVVWDAAKSPAAE